MNSLDDLAANTPSLEMVHEFHLRFKQPVEDKPNLADDALNVLRGRLIREEGVVELSEALHKQDPAKVLDALCDTQYVLDGAFLSLGFWRVKNLAMLEVHRANMRKLWPDGQPHYDKHGKVIKPPGYVGPENELKALVNLLIAR